MDKQTLSEALAQHAAQERRKTSARAVGLLLLAVGIAFAVFFIVAAA